MKLLKTTDRQELFDMIYESVAVQAIKHGPPEDGYFLCPDGIKKCAIGHVLTDKALKQFSNGSLKFKYQYEELRAEKEVPKLKKRTLKMLNAIEKGHDTLAVETSKRQYFLASWLQFMRVYADEHNLEFNYD